MKHSGLFAQIDLADYGVPLEYLPRTADSTALYQVIREHWQTFVTEHSFDNRAAPPYIVHYSERFKQCGIPAYALFASLVSTAGKISSCRFPAKAGALSILHWPLRLRARGDNGGSPLS